jgi:hypothetical protein
MSWQSFLDSLTTPGGRMFVTLTLLVWLMVLAFVMHETGHDPAEQGRLLLSNAFTALVSILLTYLAKGEK